ncbi:MAG: BrnT family toxin [Pyrinomonadaceae bacterium]
MTTYDFDWDQKKAAANLLRHKVSFELAASVFRDPLALTVFDDEHSEDEQRWVTLGLAENGMHLVVIHTFQEEDEATAKIRIISAREADKREIYDYQETRR